MGKMFDGASSFDQDIGAWDISSVDSGVTFSDGFRGFLSDGAELSPPNYDALLIGWSQLDLAEGLTFDAGESQYTEAAADERQSIIDEAGWTINDKGLAGGRINPIAYADLSEKRRDALIKQVSLHYPLSEEMIDQFPLFWNWVSLSQNEALSWSKEFIARQEDQWKWEGTGSLSSNEALPWNEELVERFESRWDWKRLSSSEALPWSQGLIKRFEDRWKWGGTGSLSSNEALPWSEGLIRQYEDKWDWKRLSENEALPWSEELIAQREDRWRWDKLSANEALPWNEELIEWFESRWDWKRLSSNEALPWSQSLIERFEDRWDWEVLSTNMGLPWSAKLIERFEDRWNWKGGWGEYADGGLSVNEALPWGREFIARHEEQWNWEAVSRNEALTWGNELIECFEDKWDWEGLSENEALPWGEELIAQYEDRWSWAELSANEALPWSEELIARYEDRWGKGWKGLSENEALPWSESLIERYEDQWEWRGLSRNKALPWSKELIARFEEWNGSYDDRWYWSILSENKALPWSRELIERYAERWDWAEIASSARTIKYITPQDLRQIASDPDPPVPVNSRVEIWKLTPTEAESIHNFSPRRVGGSEVIDSEVTGRAQDYVEQLSAEAPEAHFLLLAVQYNESFGGEYADFLLRDTRYELWKNGNRYFKDAFDPPAREGCYSRLLCYREVPSEILSGEVLQKSSASELFHGRSEHPSSNTQWERAQTAGEPLSVEEPSHPDEVIDALGEGTLGIRTYTHIRGQRLEFCQLELYIGGTKHRVFGEGNEY